MTHVFHRHCTAVPPLAVRGEGAYVIDTDGRRYFDASGGAAVSCLGHSDEDVRVAIKDQIDRLAYAHSGFFTTEPTEALADFLAARAPGDIEYFYFLSGGSEAVEAALKLARQYFLERGEEKRFRFIARRQSYHGNTLGALAVGGNMWRREPFAPLMSEGHHIDPCYEYRLRRDDETAEEYGLRAAELLRQEIERLGPETVCAFIAEPVVGATAGAVTAPPGYFKRIREICDQYGVLLILDEVMCGMGRTGTLFACEHDGIAPDIVTIAKGLGAGYQPIGAMGVSKRIYDTIRDGSGFFQHGHTYMGHATASAAALAVLRKIEEAELLHNVRRRGGQLMAALHDCLDKHPAVGDIRGRGLFVGIELVADRESKEPYDPALKLHARIKRAAMNEGLMIYPMGGTIDGRRGDHILLAPPFIVNSDEISMIADKVSAAIDAALADCKRESGR